MAIIKCKMCGGDMEISADQRCGTCEYCGSTMTLPKVDDEQRAAAFNRGNYFRRIGEFDKALLVYERIVQEDETDAEAHWCCALCRFGIEYVQDPASREYLPTCHRASFDSFLEDVDYKAALEHADPVARGQYEKDGEKIAQVQRGILSVSQKEQPFDVFICYKESDDQGNRTVDSTLAQEIYYHLTDAGYRVFFSRITLEDKAGQAYEPYIFAALHSAKVMVVVGTKPEYLNAVWVKNEWSRYLAIIKKDRKKLLIPCYRDMDPYDMPEQLSVLQSYDMSKIGFIQDLIRGISKVIVKEAPVLRTAAEPAAVPSESSGNLTALLKRGYMALEDQEWSRADDFFEQVLNLDAECGEAFFGKYLAEQQLSSMNAFVTQELDVHFSSKTIEISKEKLLEQEAAIEEYVVPGYLETLQIHGIMNAFQTSYSSQTADIQKKLQQKEEKLSRESESRLLARAFQYASGTFAFVLHSARDQILETLEQKLNSAQQSDWLEEQSLSAAFENHKRQSLEKIKKLHEEAVETREKDYQKAISLQRQRKFSTAEAKFNGVGNYKDAKVRATHCSKLAGKRTKKLVAIVASLIILAASTAYVYQNVIVPSMQYQKAETLMLEGDYDGAAAAFTELGNYKDAAYRVLETWYAKGEALMEAEDYSGAAIAFSQAIDYRDAKERCVEAQNSQEYVIAKSMLASGDLLGAAEAFEALGDYRDAAEQAKEARNAQAALQYNHALQLMKDEKYTEAIEMLTKLSGYKDSENKIDECYEMMLASKYSQAIGLLNTGNDLEALTLLDELDNYKDAESLAKDIRIRLVNHKTLVAGGWHTVGLMSNGTTVATPYIGDLNHGQCNVSAWNNIVSVAAGAFHTVGLKSDGTVVAVGQNEFTAVARSFTGRCDVSDWNDIIDVAAGASAWHTVGLKSDGTVVAVGDNRYGQCYVSSWDNIIGISAGQNHTAGLRPNGTVIATTYTSDVSTWKGIIAIASGEEHLVGLKSDGTVVATGGNAEGQCDVVGWNDIVAIAAGYEYTIGLKSDGTVVATGDNYFGQCDVSEWSDIVAIAAGRSHTLGLKSDGTVVAVGDKRSGQCNVSNWTGIKLPDI